MADAKNAVRKAMAPVDFKIAGVLFSETNVHIVPIYSKKQDKHYLQITIGKDQDKAFLVTARKDGKGVCTLTDWEDYQFAGKKAMLEQKI